MLRLFFATICLLLVQPLFAQQPDWKLAKSKQGIEVFTRLEEGQKFKSSKATANIAASLATVMEVLFDYSRYTEWSPDCLDARLVEKTGNTIVSYTMNDAPWPVSNRDIVVHNTLIEQADGSMLVNMTAIEGKVALDKGAVRIKYFEGSWKLTPRSDGTVDAIYQAIVDPEGSVPAWVINMVIEDTPYTLMKNLRTQVAKY